MQNILRTVLYSLMASFLLLGSCGPKPASNPPSVNSPQATTTIQENASSQPKNIEFRRDGGNNAFTLKTKENGAKLLDANNKELVRLTTDDQQKIKFKNADDKT